MDSGYYIYEIAAHPNPITSINLEYLKWLKEILPLEHEGPIQPRSVSQKEHHQAWLAHETIRAEYAAFELKRRSNN